MNTNDDLSYAVVMGRLAAQLGAAQDADVARALGLSGSDLANRKKRQSIPWERIVSLAATQRVSLDALIVGAGTGEDPGVYQVHRAPDCPAYRAAVAGVLDAAERAGGVLSVAQLRGLIAFADLHPLTAEELDRLLAVVVPPGPAPPVPPTRTPQGQSQINRSSADD